MTEHDEKEVRLPTEEEIRTLPRWAQVAFAARCARRVQPLFGYFWPDAPKKHLDAVDAAVTLAEDWAAAARVTAPGAAFARGAAYAASAHAAADAAGRAAAHAAHAAHAAADAANPAAEAAYAAATDAASAYAAAHAAYAGAANPAYAAAARAAAANCAATRKDYELLKTVAIREGWSNEMPVPPEFFGALWPEGHPEGWLTSQEGTDPSVHALRLQFSIPAEVDRDKADQLIQRIILAVNELYLAHGGSGLTIADNINVYENVRDPALAPA